MITKAEQALLDAAIAMKYDGGRYPTGLDEVLGCKQAVLAERLPSGVFELGHRLFVETVTSRLRWLEVSQKLEDAGIFVEGHGENPLFMAWYAEAEAIVKAERASR